MTTSVHHVTFDSLDPYALAGFWAAVLDGTLGPDDAPGDPEVEVRPPHGTALLFVRVPDGKAGKNRVHLDLRPDRPRDEEVARVLALGATQVADLRRDDGSGWVVLADPEGNELCVTRSATERGEPAPVDTGVRRHALHSAPERELLTGMLDWYREGVALKVEGLRQDLAVTSPLRSGTTVAGLVKHLAYVEDSWFTDRVAGLGEPEPWASAPFDDDPDWEFHSAAGEPLAQAVALYRAACERSRAVVAARGLEDGFVDGHGREVTVRFVLLHLVEETARHLGHLDVLCELADGRTGE